MQEVAERLGGEVEILKPNECRKCRMFDERHKEGNLDIEIRYMSPSKALLSRLTPS